MVKSSVKIVEPVEIESITSFVEIVSNFGKGCGFRGHSKLSYILRPSVGRIGKVASEGVLKREKSMFLNFKKHACMFSKDSEYIDVAMLGQHYGLPTRLLDWTYNPLVALYFAVKSNPDADGVVYALKAGVQSTKSFSYEQLLWAEDEDEMSSFERSSFCKKDGSENKEKQLNYFNYICNKYKKCLRISPRAITQRIVSQSSFFTVHANPFDSIENKVQKKIIIPTSAKGALHSQLERMGVHEYSLFPDLGGLAEWLKRTS